MTDFVDDPTHAAKSRTIGILAGGGNLPAEVIEAVLARGDAVHVLMLDGAAEPGLNRYPHTVVRWGGLGHILATLRDRTDGRLVFVGRVRRPDLRRLGPDLGFFTNLPALLRMMSGGDDAILTRVVRFFESKGVRVRGVHEVAPELVAMPGPSGVLPISDAAAADLDIGRAVLDVLGPHDVGQAVVIANGSVLGIEAAEGTDRMLERVAALAQVGVSSAGRSGVLVKAPKRGQELRIDMPAIGPATIEKVASAGLAGIAVSGGSVLIAEKARTRDLADAQGIFIHGFDAASAIHMAKSADPQPSSVIEMVRALRAADSADAAKGVAVLRALAPFGAGDGVVVSRGYVIAVLGTESIETMLQRVPQLRQWGSFLARRPRGVLVVRGFMLQDDRCADEILAAAWRAGLAGVAIDGGDTRPEVLARLRSTCPKGRFIVGSGQPEVQA